MFIVGISGLRGPAAPVQRTVIFVGAVEAGELKIVRIVPSGAVVASKSVIPTDPERLALSHDT
jgi:hypothetical protein